MKDMEARKAAALKAFDRCVAKGLPINVGLARNTRETIRALLASNIPTEVTVEEHLRAALALTSTDYQDPVEFHICRALDYIDGYKQKSAEKDELE